MPIQYTTVYQIAQLAPDWPSACIGLLPLMGGAVILWGKRRFKWTKPHWLFAVFLCVFGFICVGGVGPSVLVADWNAFTAYQKGDYRTVEGIVYNFHTMPYEFLLSPVNAVPESCSKCAPTAEPMRNTANV